MMKIQLRLSSCRPLTRSFEAGAQGSALHEWARAAVTPPSVSISITVGKNKLKQRALQLDVPLSEQVGATRGLCIVKADGPAKLVAPLESTPAAAIGGGSGGAAGAVPVYASTVVAAVDRSTWAAHLQQISGCEAAAATYFVSEARARRMDSVDQCVALFFDAGGVVPEPEPELLPTGVVHEAADADALRALLGAAQPGQLVVVDQYATWCGPCQRIAPKYIALAAQYTNAIFVKVDSDAYSLPGVSSLPTFQLHKDGSIIETLVGADPERLRALIAANR